MVKKIRKKNFNKFKAFSLVELSIVVLIIGLIVVAIIGGRSMIGLSNLSKARQLTNSSPVNAIEDLSLWLETTSKNSFLPSEGVDNNKISQWNDINSQSNIKHNPVQAISSQQPLYISSSINELPALLFDGVDDYLNTQFSFQKTATDGWTVILVFESISVGINAAIMGRVILSGESIQFQGQPSSTFRVFQRDSSGIQANNSTATNSLLSGAQFIITARNNLTPNRAELYYNGKLTGSTTGLVNFNTVTDPLYIGSVNIAGTAGGFANFKIGEIIIFDRALSESERKEIENYLSKKWNIALS